MCCVTWEDNPSPGKGKDGRVKYGTSQKIWSTFPVLWDISPEAGAGIALSSSTKSGHFVATCNPAEGRWYQFFARGCCARMGDIVKQDRAFTIIALLKLLDMYEQEYKDLGSNIPINSICSCMFLLLPCLGGMQGYEAVWTDLAALKYDVEYCENMGDYTAISWPILGRFKSHDSIAGCYMIPIAGVANSGIKFFTWTQQFLLALGREGLQKGWAFQRSNESRSKAKDYKEDIFSELEIIQASTTLNDPKCNIWDDYGVQRSGRRFSATHCTNMGVLPHLIEL